MTHELTVYDAAIAGAGLTGAALALALARGGARPVLIDPDSRDAILDPARDVRASALSPASAALWRTLLGPAVQDLLRPIRSMSLSDAKAPSSSERSALTALLAFEPGDRPGGPLGYMVENAALRSAVRAALERAEVRVMAGARVVTVEMAPSAAVVGLSDGSRITAAVVVGAEGRISKVREAAGVRTFGWGYGQTGVVATLRFDRDLDGVAHQIFLPSGPLALLPLGGGRASLVWSTRRDHAEELLAMPPEAFESHLARRLGEGFGRPRLDGRRQGFPLSLQMAESLIGPRTALVGEAGHAVHPIAGQGLNLGLKDVAALSDVLLEARRIGEDPGSDLVLQRYARWRRFDAAVLALSTDAFTRVFSTGAAPVRLLRDAGMALVGRTPWLRRALVREAAGLSGELPTLLREADA